MSRCGRRINDKKAAGDVEAQKKSTRLQKEGVDYLNPGQDDQMEVYGYVRCWLRTSVCWLCILLTCGMLRLFLHWMPKYFLVFTHKPSPLSEATKVLVIEEFQEKYKNYHVKKVKIISSTGDEESSKEDEQKAEESCLDDVQVLTEFNKEDEPKLSYHLSGGIFQDVERIKLITVKKKHYIWQQENKVFEALRGLDRDVLATNLHQQQGLTRQQQFMRRRVYGSNEIVVPVKSILALLFLEVLNPFYIFQFFSFCLWFADDYILYAMAILIMSLGGCAVTVFQTRKNQLNLHSTVNTRDMAVVKRLEGVNEKISTDELVPGDILVLPPHGCVLHCDAALLNGTCIVNESMLTGESEPVPKTPLPSTPNLLYDSKEHARHTLFCGTRLLQTRFYAGEPVLAVVVRTGFLTSKGNLVRAMLYPPPVDFHFERDSYRFVELLAAISFIGFLYTVVVKHLRGIGTVEIIVDALDLITIVVPPALPAAMTVGRMYAQSRLKKENVFCISPRTINVAGSIDCVCFDKTGTLTEEGLDLWGVLPINNGTFSAAITEFPLKSDSVSARIDELTMAMASSHSLTLIDGRLSGDPLDLKMFESTGWLLEEPAIDDSSKYDTMCPTVVQPPRPDLLMSSQHAEIEVPQVGIFRQFPFSSSLQRMCVVVRALWESEFRIFCKGAPEAVISLCRADTVPKDFLTILHSHTRQGLRVLALAGRKLKVSAYHRIHRLAREDVEAEMTLLGLLVMENRLKKDSAKVICSLRESNIRCIMVTGDNMLTALSVARDCGLVSNNERVAAVHVQGASEGQPARVYHTDCDRLDMPEAANEISTANKWVLAVSGQTWQALRTSCPSLTVAQVAARGAVFARMSPEHKQQLVQELQTLGYCVGMVGDGANDCGALKAAHAGISLSDAESSVASPFTSKEPSVECVQRLLRESRAALVTSFGLFKYMAAYSLTQFVSVMLLYEFDNNLSDVQFLFIDLFLITLVAFFFGRSGSHPGPLAKRPPSSSLFSLAPVTSLISQLMLGTLAQILAVLLITSYSWYTPFDPEQDTLACYENYAVFSVSAFQYLVLAAVFSRGPPYREPLYTNVGMMITLILGTLLSVVIVLVPPMWLEKFVEFKLPPEFSPRLFILALAVIHAALSFGLEAVLMRCHFKESHPRHLDIDKDLAQDPQWPPMQAEPLHRVPSETPETPNAKMSVVLHRNGEVTLDPAKLVMQSTPKRTI
ncbi:polyamine-transporting ATPase 13A3-like isoform X2 [Neocloeon triangulifer]|uniref:polyamine-transporting ATPase 13A3-like isoform X2 n=1 Tax=Neocloeon triangulifer TaxID=2078957 RepID=UPI00286EE412|nr:polyamine-transporting ATPase 13A3-like isoform X2 [Neocloeon triangulifer]